MSERFNRMMEENRNEPFLKGLPEKYHVIDELIPHGCPDPDCKGEVFGRCECCNCYFCHGKCGDVMSMEDIVEAITDPKSYFKVEHFTVKS